MPSQSAEHIRTTILKVGSNGEIVREIKRKQQLNLHRTVAGAARCNPEVAGSSPAPATKLKETANRYWKAVSCIYEIKKCRKHAFFGKNKHFFIAKRFESCILFLGTFIQNHPSISTCKYEWYVQSSDTPHRFGFVTSGMSVSLFICYKVHFTLLHLQAGSGRCA